MAFDPDAYLAQTGGFDPDAYLEATGGIPPPAPAQPGFIGKTANFLKSAFGFHTFDNPAAQLLERKGQEVKGATQNAISNMVGSPPPSFLSPQAQESVQFGKALFGTAASAVTDVGPFTPSELSTAIGSEVAPAALFSKVNRGTAKAVANKFAPTPLKEARAAVKSGDELIGQKLLKYPDLKGSREEVLQKTFSKVDEVEDQIQDRLAEVAKEEIVSGYNTVSRDQIASALDKEIDNWMLTGVNQKEVNAVLRMKRLFLKNQPQTMNVMQANKIKRQFYKQIGDTGYLTQKPTANVQAEKILANSLKRAIEETIPSISDLNSRLGDFLDIRDSLIQTIPKGESGIIKGIFGDVKEKALLGTARFLSTPNKTPLAAEGVAAGGTFLRQRKK